jgi:hypothetical protein
MVTKRFKKGPICRFFKVEVKSVLRIGSAHNNVRTSNVKIAQISNVSNFSEHKLYFIFI